MYAEYRKLQQCIVINRYMYNMYVIRLEIFSIFTFEDLRLT